MDLAVSPAAASELAAAFLQAAITLALAALCAFLYHRYRKPYFAIWAVAWLLYVLRLGAIISFLATADRHWLYWHQVVTGWTALALLWAALVFSQSLRWRWTYLAVALFPPLWSYVAIYRLDRFLLAALPAVLFLSFATVWTGLVFLRYHRRVGSTGAAVLAVALLLWGAHHLDYPFLRARGAWNPWGYYLDLLFELALGAGILLLVVDELGRGIGALSALSGDLQRGGDGDVLEVLLRRLLTLPAVRGSALYIARGAQGTFVRGAGACAAWTGTRPVEQTAWLIEQVIGSGRPAVAGAGGGAAAGRPAAARHAYTAVLPVLRGSEATGAIVIVGDARDPFAALDERFLLALGQQVGAALEHADLDRRLEARTAELERLSARMVQQHEEERRRLSRELHDETAQVFSAVKMELGVLRERAEASVIPGLDRALGLMDSGIRSIRNVTADLRPSLLDDLGLLPALRALVSDFEGRSGIATSFDAPPRLPALSREAELALFRALQEALANVARHAGAGSVTVHAAVEDGGVTLTVRDDGLGLPGDASVEGFEANGHMGLAGMRERIGRLGGRVAVANADGGGLRVAVSLPAAAP